MSLAEPPIDAVDVIFENILAFLLPFFLFAAGSEAALARSAIRELAEAYDAATVTELELVGRILGFSVVAMDNLRLSMAQGMSDNKKLRYRSNAVALSRAGDRCREILDIVQSHRTSAHKTPPSELPRVPAPAVEPAPPVPAPKAPAGDPVASNSKAPIARLLATALPAGGLPADFLSGAPKDIESMKRDARILIAAFARNGAASGPATAVLPTNPDPAAMVDAAVRQAFAQTRGQTKRASR